MTAHSILTLTGATRLRRLIRCLVLVGNSFDRLWRARRHRREAARLARLDSHMLADIGLYRADLSDAFSAPFWEDPTALLRERALERRINRPGVRAANQCAAYDFHRPLTERRSRQVL